LRKSERIIYQFNTFKKNGNTRPTYYHTAVPTELKKTAKSRMDDSMVYDVTNALFKNDENSLIDDL